MSFTLNRVYTEWYRNKGYSFTITSSTAFDHKWIPNRNIFESISEVVDEVFASYLSRPNVRQPILTQYCDGQTGQLSQLAVPVGLQVPGGSELYSLLRFCAIITGMIMYINSAEEISGIPVFLARRDSGRSEAAGQKVEQLQEQLNAIVQQLSA